MEGEEPALALDAVERRVPFDRFRTPGTVRVMSASRRRPTSRFQPGMAAMYAWTGASPSAFAICGLPPERSFGFATFTDALGFFLAIVFTGGLSSTARTVLAGGDRGSARKKSSNCLAFPHPQSCKDKCRKKDKPSGDGVVRNFFEWTINIAGYGNAKDDVNPAKDRTFGGWGHEVVLLDRLKNERRRKPRITFFWQSFSVPSVFSVAKLDLLRLLLVVGRRARDHDDKLFEHLRPTVLGALECLFAKRLGDIEA